MLTCGQREEGEMWDRAEAVGLNGVGVGRGADAGCTGGRMRRLSLVVGEGPGPAGSCWPFKPGIVGPGSTGSRNSVLGLGEGFYCPGLGQLELQLWV